MPPKRIIKVGLALIQDGALLLARSQGDVLFQIPGGKIEPGESDAQALVRESAEELAVVLDAASLEHLGTFEAPAAGRPGVVVEVRLYAGKLQGEPSASSEIAELLWQPIDADAPNATDVVRRRILPFLAGMLAEKSVTNPLTRPAE